jgi:hypothetical protein
VIVPTSSVAAVRLRGSIEVAYEDQMSARDLIPGRCGLRAGNGTAGARCFGLRGGSEMLSCVASLKQTTSRRLSSAEVDKLSHGRGAEAAECRIGLTLRNELKRLARADAEYRADMQAGSHSD